MHPTTLRIIELFHRSGNSQYGHESVTQLQHALQAAWMGEQDGADAALITAALLHDIGHLLHDLPDDAPDQGIDDRHEVLGEQWLTRHFGPEVVDPVRMHVDAKRYLCTAEADYLAKLSPPSVQSLHLQGGLMNAAEVEVFRAHPHFERAVRLRRWDDEAKDPALETPPIGHFARYIDEVAGQGVTT